MAIILFRRPTQLPVHPKAWIRPAGNVDFRVTVDFDDPDAYFHLKHRAVDLGNTRCGDVVVAMADGYCLIKNDTSGALGIEIDHGYNIVTGYWHLSTRTVSEGQAVRMGYPIGTVGKTGLDIGGCHLHTECKSNGILIDPEPLIMGGYLTIGEEDSMKIPDGMQAIARARASGNFRVTPWTTAGSIPVSSAVTVQALGDGVQGEIYTINGIKGNEYAVIGYRGNLYYVARPKLTNIKLAT